MTLDRLSPQQAQERENRAHQRNASRKGDLRSLAGLDAQGAARRSEWEALVARQPLFRRSGKEKKLDDQLLHPPPDTRSNRAYGDIWVLGISIWGFRDFCWKAASTSATASTSTTARSLAATSGKSSCNRVSASPSNANTGPLCQKWKPEAQWRHEISWVYRLSRMPEMAVVQRFIGNGDT